MGLSSLAVFAFIGHTFFVVFSEDKEMAEKAKLWPAQKARITHSELKIRKPEGLSRNDRRQWEWELDIRGVLVDSGREFRVWRPTYGEVMTKEKYEHYVKMCPKGEVVTVYVNPEDPTIVILNRDP